MMEEITVDELYNAAAYYTGINAKSRNSYKLSHVTMLYAKSNIIPLLFFLSLMIMINLLQKTVTKTNNNN